MVPLTRVCLRLSYDGSHFSGFAENRGVRTVAGEIRTKLERIYRQPIKLTCSGRTDAGVHAREQFVHFDVASALVEPDRLSRSLNSFLAPQVVVDDVSIVDDGFSARYSARWRSYRYQVLNAPLPEPFLAQRAWWVHEDLDRIAMGDAAELLIGTHDFSTFCRRPRSKPDASLVRTVLEARWQTVPGVLGSPELLQFQISATAFCHQMVRAIVGFLVDIGRGRFDVGEVERILASGDRSRVGNLAPPHGLYLWRVGFEPYEPEVRPGSGAHPEPSLERSSDASPPS